MSASYCRELEKGTNRDVCNFRQLLEFSFGMVDNAQHQDAGLRGR